MNYLPEHLGVYIKAFKSVAIVTLYFLNEESNYKSIVKYIIPGGNSH